MRSWLPVKGERWVYHVEVEAIRQDGPTVFVRYRPTHMQQRGAVRELEEGLFLAVFHPEQGPRHRPLTGSRWLLLVEVVSVDRAAMAVGYRHINPTGAPLSEPKDVRVHVFRATFRRELCGDERLEKHPEWERERREWQAVHGRPKRGECYVLDVHIVSTREDQGRRFVKYVPDEVQQYTAPRELEERHFLKTFEPVDGAADVCAPDDEWFMRVEVTDYDDEDFSVWYRAVDSTGERRGEIKHLSDYVFLATFAPE